VDGRFAGFFERIAVAGLERNIAVVRGRDDLYVQSVPARVAGGADDRSALHRRLDHDIAQPSRGQERQLGLQAHINPVGDRAPQRRESARGPSGIDREQAIV